MSILEKLNKAIMEKDGAAAGELVHDDYKMFSHLKGEYVCTWEKQVWLKL